MASSKGVVAPDQEAERERLHAESGTGRPIREPLGQLAARGTHRQRDGEEGALDTQRAHDAEPTGREGGHQQQTDEPPGRSGGGRGDPEERLECVPCREHGGGADGNQPDPASGHRPRWISAT
jgi:hypothetical protein